MDRIIEQWLAVNSEKHDHLVQELNQEIDVVVKQYAEKWFARHWRKKSTAGWAEDHTSGASIVAAIGCQ